MEMRKLKKTGIYAVGCGRIFANYRGSYFVGMGMFSGLALLELHFQ
jgi:hypothetical protein